MATTGKHQTKTTELRIIDASAAEEVLRDNSARPVGYHGHRSESGLRAAVGEQVVPAESGLTCRVGTVVCRGRQRK